MCHRFLGLLVAQLGAAVWLAACAGSPLPAVTWVRLPAEPPAVVAAPAPVQEVQGVWQLMAPVLLPGHLDRDALLVPQGAAGLQALGGARWAEPLRDAVPRLLRQDLAREFATPVWLAPLPPGVLPTRQLRVEFTALDVSSDGRGVELRARWSLADPKGAVPPTVFDAAFTSAATGAGANELAAAHRQALAQLARRIADTAGTR
jgi:uncharacterized lipoprotein YmbA